MVVAVAVKAVLKHIDRPVQKKKEKGISNERFAAQKHEEAKKKKR